MSKLAKPCQFSIIYTLDIDYLLPSGRILRAEEELWQIQMKY